MVTDPWLLIFLVFALLVLLGTASGLMNARLCISEPLACMTGGSMLGLYGFNLLSLDPMRDPVAMAIVHEAAQVTLATAVMGAAIQLPRGWLQAQWQGVAVALGPGMVFRRRCRRSCGARPTLGGLLPNRGSHRANRSRAVNPGIDRALARRAVPEDLRNGLTAESGVDDGLALPLVMLPVLLLGHAPDEAGLEWVFHILLWEAACASLIGGVTGWVTLRGLRWARRRPEAERTSLITVTLALAIATLAGVRLLDGRGILAAFLAGMVLNEGIPDEEAAGRQARFN